MAFEKGNVKLVVNFISVLLSFFFLFFLYVSEPGSFAKEEEEEGGDLNASKAQK